MTYISPAIEKKPSRFDSFADQTIHIFLLPFLKIKTLKTKLVIDLWSYNAWLVFDT